MRNKLLLLLLLGLARLTSAQTLELPRFDQDGIQDWEKKIFEGETVYRIVDLDGDQVLQASSNGTASGLVHEQRIDLLHTPYINWRWRIGNKLAPLAEQTKAGDDYVARLYLVIDGGLLPWNSKALNYVWSSASAAGTVWDNAYAGSNVRMLAVRDAQSEAGQWYTEKRNLYQDLIRYLGDKGSEEANLKAYRYIDAVAIMTDTDNSQLQAESYYGNISFTSQ